MAAKAALRVRRRGGTNARSGRKSSPFPGEPRGAVSNTGVSPSQLGLQDTGPDIDNSLIAPFGGQGRTENSRVWLRRSQGQPGQAVGLSIAAPIFGGKEGRTGARAVSGNPAGRESARSRSRPNAAPEVRMLPVRRPGPPSEPGHPSGNILGVSDDQQVPGAGGHGHGGGIQLGPLRSLRARHRARESPNPSPKMQRPRRAGESTRSRP